MNKRTVFCILLLFAFIALIVLWHSFKGLPNLATGDGFCADAVHMYSKAIETEKVTDWHSDLCMYEAIGLKKIVFLLFGVALSSFQIMGILFYGAVISLIACMGYWIFLCAKRYNCGFFSMACFFVAYAILDKYARFSLDFSFVAALSLYITTLMMYSRQKKRWAQIILLCLIFVLSIHLVALRRNSIVVIPFITYPVFCIGLSEIKKRVFRLGAVLLYTVMVQFCATNLISLILPVKKTFPVSVMLSSEMRMAAILRGEIDYSDNPFIKDVFRNQYSLIQDSSCSGGKIVLFDYYNLPGAFETDETKLFRSIKQRYLSECLHHPEEIACVKCLQIIQFLYGAQTPETVKKIVQRLYPHVATNPRAWDFREGRYWVTPKRSIFNFSIIMGAFASAMMLLIKCKTNLLRDEITGLVFMCGLVGGIYLVSFFIITPSPDQRYISAAVAVSLCSLGVFAEYLIAQFRGRLQSRFKC